MANRFHSLLAYPHASNCPDCRAKLLCNVCGTSIKSDFGRCTNGKCASCHATTCTQDGATAPGHVDMAVRTTES